MATLNLISTIGYTVNSSDDEWKSSDKGLYKDSNIASIKAKGAGWYNSDGKVRQVENLYEDEIGNLYIVIPKGKFNDVEEAYRQQTIESIKSKLTKEELELLNL